MVYVDANKCDGCGHCIEACPQGALKLVDGVVQVDLECCQETGTCLETCPQGALLQVTEPSDPRVHTLRKAPASILERHETRVSRARSSTYIVPWLSAAIRLLVTDVVPELWHAWGDRRQSTRRGSSPTPRITGKEACRGPRRQRRRRQQERRS